jgi:hemolysin activation/secretion protein
MQELNERKAVLSALLLFGLSSAVFAQDAGSFDNQFSEGMSANQEHGGPATVNFTAPRLVDFSTQVDDGFRFTINGFSVKGNSLISSERIHEILQDSVGKNLGIVEIKNLRVAIADAYQAEGYLANVILPPQDVTEGLITFEIIEGRAGVVRILENTSQVRSERLAGFLSAVHPRGDYLNTSSLEHSLVLLDEWSGLTVSAQLGAGEEAGESDILLSAEGGKRFSGTVSMNNYGSDSLGETQLVSDLNFASPAGLGDSLRVTLQKNEGSYFSNLNYKIPIGNKGLMLQYSGSRMEYSVLGSVATDSSGSAVSNGLAVSYPMVRTSEGSLDGFLSFDTKDYVNLDPLDNVNTDYTNNSATIGVRGYRYFDDAMLRYGVSISAGDLDLSASPNKAADAASANTQGRYTTFNFDLLYRANFAEQWTFTGKVEGQLASKNLDSSNKFGLGGVNSLRAYSSGAISGADGLFVSGQVDRQITDEISLYAFAEIGVVQLYKETPIDFLGSNSETLKGVGVGATYTFDGWVANASWAHPVGSQFDASPPRAGLEKGQLWLSVGRQF